MTLVEFLKAFGSTYIGDELLSQYIGLWKYEAQQDYLNAAEEAGWVKSIWVGTGVGGYAVTGAKKHKIFRLLTF